MNVLRYILLSASALLGVPWPATAMGQSLPSATEIRRVEVILMTHNKSTSPIKYRRGLTEFDQATTLQLPPAVEKIRHSKPWRRPQRPQNYVAWLESRALERNQGPLVGPIKWAIPASPQLNYPLLKRSLWSPSPSFQSTLDALAQSSEWTVVQAASWFQALSREPQAIKLGQACSDLVDYAAFTWTNLQLTCAPEEPMVYGMVSVQARQFVTANVSVVEHYSNSPRQGPLRAEYLASTGTGYHQLEARRAISEDIWQYFDSDALGVLLRVRRLDSKD